MEKKYRVALLVENAPDCLESRFYRRLATSRHNALLDVLASLAGDLDLRRVKMSRVTEAPDSTTLTGLHAVV